MDYANLALAIKGGGEVASICHELIWMQPFPNGNHRTAIAAAMEAMAMAMPPLEEVDSFLVQSKKLLDGSKGDNVAAKSEHLELVVNLLSRFQSRNR